MKRPKVTRFSILVLIAALSACGPQATAPGSTQAPPANTVAPAPTEAVPPATLAPVALAGPEMKVGSKYPYVDGTILVAVPGGPFTMGRGGLDNPEHQVTLSDFWIYSTKVTNQQYAFCVLLGQCTPPDAKDNANYTDPKWKSFPVVGVNWSQADAYCKFVHGELPTEAQWEKTARGPVDVANIYPWGNNAPVCDVLNFNNCVGKTTRVDHYLQGASYYSALDMEGNAFEWAADWYDFLYYKKSTAQDPMGPDVGTERSVRSAGYKAVVDQVQAAVRFKANPNDHRRDLGFRCVVEDPTWFAPFCTLPVTYGTSTSGGSSGESNDQCKPPKIVAKEDCAGYNQVNNVHLESTPPTKITSVTVTGNGSCNPALTDPSDTSVHVCDLGLTITITAVCDIKASTSGTGTCPSEQYQLSTDGTTCTAIGTQGACLPGYSLDPALLCCAPTSSTTTTTICATGFHEYQGSCVSDDNGPYDVPGDSILTQSGKTCTHRGGDNNNNNPCPAGQHQYCFKNETGGQTCECIEN